MRRYAGFVLGAIAMLAVVAQAGKTADEQRVARARSYEKKGQEYVAKANEALKTTRLAASSRASLSRQNFARAATALKRARALVKGRKDELSTVAATEITRALVDVMNIQARAYLDKQSLVRASRLVKAVLKMSPKDSTALRIKREIEEAKRKDPAASGGYGSQAYRRWQERRAGTGAGQAGSRGRGGGGGGGGKR